MSLPASQKRVLTGIEAGLLARDPRLKSLFTIFTRLTWQEAMPSREQLQPRRWRLRPGPVIVVAVVFVLVGVVLGSLAGPARVCSSTTAHRAVATAPGNPCVPATGSRAGVP